MAKIFIFFIFLACFFSFGNLLEIRRTCTEKKLNDLVINGYYRLRINVTLPPIKEYLNDLLNQPKRREMTAFVGGVYQENFFKNLNSKKVEAKKDEFESFVEKNRYSMSDYSLDHQHEIHLKFEKFQNLLNDLSDLTNNTLPQLVTEDILKESINTMDCLGETQSSPFADAFLSTFYYQKLASLDSFKLNRSDNEVYLDTETTGSLSISLFIPFYDEKYENLVSPLVCNKLHNNLPPFFTSDS